jgi:1,4-dihydroxy-2-naphthoyl-CoA hydrolase
MSIWKHPVDLDALQSSATADNMLHALGIRFTAVGDDYLEATMPVDARTRQPAGILHGGASCVLAETLGSVASNLVAGYGEQECLGIEINANHLNAVRSGLVTGRVTPTRLGRSLHVWDIRLTDDAGRLTCVSRLTVMVRPKRQGS